jgi:predicted alpha/beta hydrolase family esterase
MNRAIILHGMSNKDEYYNLSSLNSSSNSHWIPWLQQKLCQNDILSQAPEMPKPYQPNYDDWKTAFEMYKPDESTIIIAHSLGGGFIVRWLSDNPDKKVGKVVLVAPWLDIDSEYAPLFSFDVREDISQQTSKGIHLLHSTNDNYRMKKTLQYLQDNTNGLKYYEFVDYGHFTFRNMKTREFPELLQICLPN